MNHDYDIPEPAKISQPHKTTYKAPAPAKLLEKKKPHCRTASAALPPQEIPRPCNQCIIFWTDFTSKRKSAEGRKKDADNPAIFKAAGEAWSELEDKSYWAERAAIEKAEHKKLYPDYHYGTPKSIKTKFRPT
jgi:hypothetical protein